MEGLEDWPVRALADPDLVAHAVVRLRLASWPVDSGPSNAAAMALPPAWGCRVWCPRRGRPWRIGDNKDAAASRRCIGGSRDAAASRWRPSLMTPLESFGGSGASQSGSDGIETSHCSIRGPDSGGCGGVARHQTKVVVAGERISKVFKITEPKAIRRTSIHKLVVVAGEQNPTVFKNTEPKAIRRTLIQKLVVVAGERNPTVFKNTEPKAIRRTLIQKLAVVAGERNPTVFRITEPKAIRQPSIQKLLRLKSLKRSSTCLRVSEETRPKRLQMRDSFVPLPDLNIPLVEEWD